MLLEAVPVTTFPCQQGFSTKSDAATLLPGICC